MPVVLINNSSLNKLPIFFMSILSIAILIWATQSLIYKLNQEEVKATLKIKNDAHNKANYKHLSRTKHLLNLHYKHIAQRYDLSYIAPHQG